MATMTARLPNLLIAGVPRGGTSSLFAYLGQHPDVCAATTKEVRFFTPLMDPAGALPSMESYGRYFAHCEGQRYALEATPSYCYGGSRVLSAINETLPDPRIIITLRDPVERLISAYRFQRARDNIPTIRSFEEYVAACQEEHRAGGRRHLRGTPERVVDRVLRRVRASLVRTFRRPSPIRLLRAPLLGSARRRDEPMPLARDRLSDRRILRLRRAQPDGESPKQLLGANGVCRQEEARRGLAARDSPEEVAPQNLREGQQRPARGADRSENASASQRCVPRLQSTCGRCIA